uniref:K Homology domain-containing protein n=1 Tax=Oryza glaberrima TaxID=4538 RepID=I1QQ50_ORYGL
MEISPNSAAAAAAAAAVAAAPASSSTSSPSAPKRLTTTLRILCPSSRASVLRGASRDLHVDQPPVGDEAVLSISGPDAPAVAVRAWERVVGHRVGGDEAAGEEEREVPGVVGCRMLAASGQVGCVLGKGGKTVERMRQESGAQIRVFRNRDQLPPWAAPVDELIHISGNFSAVRKALLLVTTCLQDNPRPDASNFPPGRFGPPGPVGIDPHSQRGYLPPSMPDYHARNYSSNMAAPGSRFFVEQEIVFRMICLNEMVGSIIGKGGSTIRALQSETGASIKIIEPNSDSEERVIVMSAHENSEMMHSPAQDAVLRVHSRISESSMDKSSAVTARLLVPSQHIGCLLGKGGSIIAEMRKITGAGIRIFGNEQIPRCAQRNDELVQVTGSFQSIQDALLHITGRIRDVIIPMKPHPGGGMPPYPPGGNAPPHHPRQEPAPPHPTGGMPPYPMPSFRADRPMGPFDMVDHRPPPPHSMEHMGADRMPYSYGCEQGGGPRPFLDQPSPSAWAPEPDLVQAPNSEAPRNMPETVPPADFRKGAVAGTNQVATPSNATEVIIPRKYIGFICGANGSDLAEIKKMSGATITVHHPKPGDANALVIICGDPDQTKKAQSLLHAFIFCGLYQT